MACWCEQTEKMKQYAWTKEMAKKTALLTDSMQVIYKHGEVFAFAPYDGFEGDYVEIISNI